MSKVRWHESLLLTLLLVSSSILPASTDSIATTDEQVTIPTHSKRFAQGLFWKVEKDNQTSGYILGTVHMNDARITALPDKVKKAIDVSSSFAMESFPDDYSTSEITGGPSNSVQSGVGLGAYVRLENGQTLESVIGEDLFKRVFGVLSGLGFTREQIQPLKPWVVMNSISIRSPHEGQILDRKLLDYANTRVQDLYRIEYPEELLSAFYDMPMETQISLLEDAVDNYPNLQSSLNEMRDAYLKEDLQAMADISTSFISSDTDKSRHKEIFLKHAVYIRNIVMEFRMLAPLRMGGAFIALGAIHLNGEKGVLALLEKDGYTVTRIH